MSVGIPTKHAQSLEVAGAIGASAAFFALAALAFQSGPFVDVDQFAVLSGSTPLTAERLTAFRDYLAGNFAIDSMYLFGSAAMWLGLASAIAEEHRFFGRIVIVLGLAGALADFCENEMRWAALSALQSGAPLSRDYVAGWQVVFGMS